MMEKYQKRIITSGFIVLGIIVLNIIISMTAGVDVISNTINLVTNKKEPNMKEVNSINLTSKDYESNIGGSYDIKKSAEWTGSDKAQIKFDVKTRSKQNNLHKDVILVLDISGSMDGEKLDRVKSDAKDLTESLLADSENRVALITFETKSKIEYELTNNKDLLLSKIDSLTYGDTTNYNQALINVDKVLKNYKKRSDCELVVLFLTDGSPNEENPNQVVQYKLLKDKYPYITINGIQYEMGKDIVQDIKNISDNQYIASMDTLNNILFEAVDTLIFYEKFELKDEIDDEHFYVESIDDINASMGKVELVEEDGIQKVIWTADSNEFRTGSSANMTIDIKLKEQYVGNEGYYPTNEGLEITTKLPGEKEIKQDSDETPILKAGYKVYYDTNMPTGCKSDNFEETHYAFENVKISDKEFNCDGYQFKGWEIVDKVKQINADYFIMPIADVHLVGIWTKQSIAKSMDGTVHIALKPSIMRSYTSSDTDDYHKYKTQVTKIVFSDNINVPSTALESWDVSNEQNGSVIAYMEDDGTGNGTYKVTIGGNGKVIANENSSNLFIGFTNLKEIQLEHFDTSNVTNMSGIFANCNSLTKLDLNNINTSKVKDMSGMFANCRGFTTLDVTGLDTSSATNMNGMFSSCTNLATLDLSTFNTSNVTTFGGMFSGCTNLTTIDLSSFDTSNATIIGGMFSMCTNLTNLDISHFDTSKVTDFSSMFLFSRKLTTTINIKSTNAQYNSMFYSTATDNSAQITVNYTSENEALVDAMIATKTVGSNVIKGQLITN